ncbi:MAG TPA: sulfur oxidation c-type cytochrome SoxX [Chromatiales bacterium]|nr:sulfur oxidation c-type cytochrome SoxX [Chromatiales bacterium]
MTKRQPSFLLSLVLGLVLCLPAPAAEPYHEWKVTDFAIEQPLGGLQGDPARGRQVVIDKRKGNCLACHVLPIPEEPFHGTIGPPLTGVASRLTEGQLRLRVVDEKQVNPMTIMPGYYRDPEKFTLVLDKYAGKTFLTAQEVEDVVAYLKTLK